MAIFLTIMAGVAAVFAGSVDTVRQGYRNMEAFEIGRSTLGVLEQDLKNAFTARELGQNFQFFGTPYGFMFVGALDNGQLGRVTYAVNEDVGVAEPFKTEITDTLGAFRGRLVEQALSLGISLNVATTEVESWIRDLPDVDDDPNIPINPNQISPWGVSVVTGGLIRYAETGIADLDTLPLPPGLRWPNVDANDWRLDTYDIKPEYLSKNADLYTQVLTALNPDANGVDYDLDIRTLIQDFPRNVNSLTAIRADTIKTFVETRKREIWLQLVAGRPVLDNVNFWQDIFKSASDYVVADSIVIRAIPLNGGAGEPLVWTYLGPDGTPISTPANVLYHPAFFYYSNSEAVNRDKDYSPYFNALQNIEPARGLANGMAYSDFMANPTYSTLFAFDQTLSNLLGETRLAADSLGSPLLPQLPNIVRPGFWLMKPATRPGGADFRRWFGQGIDVPSALNRSVEASMVPNPNQV